MTLLSPSGKKKGAGAFRKVLVVAVLAALCAGVFWLQRELRLPAPAIVELSASKPAIGPRTVFRVKASEPVLGLLSTTVIADGGGLVKQVMTPDKNGELVIGKEAHPQLKPGPLTITVTVQANGTKLRTPKPIVVTQTFEVRIEPPSLVSTSSFVHPAQGGAEVVVYEVGPSSVRDGVQAGGWFSPGSQLPGGQPSQRMAIFSVPYDLEVSEAEAKGKILLVAEDELGNRVEQQFIHKFFPRPMGRDTIELKEPFMRKVTGEIYARTPELAKTGNLVTDYLQLNGALRTKNMAELKELAVRSQAKFLWAEPFVPMQNAAVKGAFADRRTYTHGGKDVDTQDHLGFDLASFERASVQAANAGVVVLARYFGIFGNCVVVDHGFGLMTLYAHLSTIGVKEGDAVALRQELGKTGATGLAGGDHLHVTTVLHGLPVNPIEWWDGHWIQDRVRLKVGDALPLPAAASQ
jgi:murein DD-endopeptidase MepM/ murein hydrolase activator NlpD